jgi:hypothetical protein
MGREFESIVSFRKNRYAKEWCLLGAKGVEYPTRFFARDYAGNRLEFSL